MNRPKSLSFVVFVFLAGCGGGGTERNLPEPADTPPRVVIDGGQQLHFIVDDGPLPVLYRIRDRERDAADVEIEVGVDRDGDGSISLAEYRPAAEAGGDGLRALATSPRGVLHSFVWDLGADIGTRRHVTVDYVWTDDGRVARDDVYGEPMFADRPGARVRIRARANGLVGPWAYSVPFDASGNHAPEALLDSVELAPSGEILVRWRAIDADGDEVTVAVDWAPVPTSGPPGDTDLLHWRPATPGVEGDGFRRLEASPEGTPHVSSLAAGTGAPDAIAVRLHPLDTKDEPGDWTAW